MKVFNIQYWGIERVEETEPISQWRQWLMTQFQLLWQLYVWFGVAWYWNQRTHSPYRILLELRTHSPRPTLVVSLQGRLPNPHKLGHPAIHNCLLDCSRPWRLTVWRMHSLKGKRLQSHTGTTSSVMLNHLVFGLWFGVWGISSLMIYSRRLWGIWVALMTSVSF